jgi:hypothetical protein
VVVMITRRQSPLVFTDAHQKVGNDDRGAERWPQTDAGRPGKKAGPQCGCADGGMNRGRAGHGARR